MHSIPLRSPWLRYGSAALAAMLATQVRLAAAPTTGMSRQPQAIAAIVQRTLEVLEPRIGHAHIRVEQGFPAALKPVLADAEQIKQVLLNLIGKAAEAMPQGGYIRLLGAAQRSAFGYRAQQSGPGRGATVVRPKSPRLGPSTV
jgi:C4-dicarboxylate-specific signal transduction histidine kinase